MRMRTLTALVLAASISTLARGEGTVQPQAEARAAQEASSGTTNADVVRMVKAGIPEETILLDIQKVPNCFEASPAALIRLKEQDVPNSVIQEMVRLAKPQSGEGMAGAKLAEQGAQAAGDSKAAAGEASGAASNSVATQSQPGGTVRPPAPLTGNFVQQGLSFRYPEDWLPFESKHKRPVSLMLGPEGGVRLDAKGRQELLCGMSFGPAFAMKLRVSVPWWSVAASISAMAVPDASLAALPLLWAGERLPFPKAIKEIEQAQMESNWGLTFDDSAERAFAIDRRKAVQGEWTKAEGKGEGERGIELFVENSGVWCFAAPGAAFDAYRPKFQQVIDSMSFAVDGTAPKIPGRATVLAKSDPPGADIALDDVYAGYTPNTIHPAAGRHSISIAKPGFEPWRGIVLVAPEASFAIDAKLQALDVKAQ